jgi:hypothetical protein
MISAVNDGGTCRPPGTQHGQPHTGRAEAVDHQQRAMTAVVGAAALGVHPATLALRVQRLGYVDHD